MTAAYVAAQNLQFGRTTDRHADDRVTAPIGGYAHEGRDQRSSRSATDVPNASVLTADSERRPAVRVGHEPQCAVRPDGADPGGVRRRVGSAVPRKNAVPGPRLPAKASQARVHGIGSEP
jgi:hypothetical protein